MELWTKCTGGTTYVTEISDLRSLPGGNEPTLCPHCQEIVSPLCFSHTDYYREDGPDEGDIAGWNYIHNCGAKLLIIND